MPSSRSLTVICLWLLCLTFGSLLPAAPPDQAPLIRVGGSLDDLHGSSVTDAEISFKLIFNELLADAGEHFIITIYDTNDAVVDEFRKGRIQGVFLNPEIFLKLGELIHPNGRYVVQYGPSIKQRYLILVRNDHKNDSLGLLRGHKLSLAAGHLIGKRFLDVMLLEQGLPESDRFFSEIDQTKETNAAVIDLFFGKVDVALVPEYGYQLACELNPQIEKSLSVLYTSEPMIYQAVGMRYDFPQERLDRIEPHILQLNPSRKLEHLLKTFRIAGLHRLDDDTLKEVRELEQRYRQLTHQSP